MYAGRRKSGAHESTAPFLFLQENFRETKATAGEFTGIVVSDEGDTFLADFGEEYFPGILGDLFGVGLAPGLLWLLAVFRWLVARLGLFLISARLWCFRHKGDGFLDDDGFLRDGWFGFLLDGLALSTAAAAALLIRFGNSVRFGFYRGGSFRLRRFTRGLAGNPANLGFAWRIVGADVCLWGHGNDGKAEKRGSLVVVDVVGSSDRAVLAR